MKFGQDISGHIRYGHVDAVAKVLLLKIINR